MKQRKLVIGLLVMLAVAVSGFTFAFWAAGVDGVEDTVTGTVTIGESTDVYATTVDLSAVLDGAGDFLVPSGKAATSAAGAVEEVVLTYDVQWDEANGSTGYTGVLSAAGVPTLTGTDTNDYSSLISVVASYTEGQAITVNGDAVLVTFTITFASEPASQAAYEAIINQNISIEFTFTVVED